MSSTTGLPKHVDLCVDCGQKTILGMDESHSNRCPVFGGHSEERCTGCGGFYRPKPGWKGDRCPRCVGGHQPAAQPQSLQVPDRRRNVYTWGPNGFSPNS